MECIDQPQKTDNEKSQVIRKRDRFQTSLRSHELIKHNFAKPSFLTPEISQNAFLSKSPQLQKKKLSMIPDSKFSPEHGKHKDQNIQQSFGQLLKESIERKIKQEEEERKRQIKDEPLIKNVPFGLPYKPIYSKDSFLDFLNGRMSVLEFVEKQNHASTEIAAIEYQKKLNNLPKIALQLIDKDEIQNEFKKKFEDQHRQSKLQSILKKKPSAVSQIDQQNQQNELDASKIIISNNQNLKANVSLSFTHQNFMNKIKNGDLLNSDCNNKYYQKIFSDNRNLKQCHLIVDKACNRDQQQIPNIKKQYEDLIAQKQLMIKEVTEAIDSFVSNTFNNSQQKIIPNEDFKGDEKKDSTEFDKLKKWRKDKIKTFYQSIPVYQQNKSPKKTLSQVSNNENQRLQEAQQQKFKNNKISFTDRNNFSERGQMIEKTPKIILQQQIKMLGSIQTPINSSIISTQGTTPYNNIQKRNQNKLEIAFSQDAKNQQQSQNSINQNITNTPANSRSRTGGYQKEISFSQQQQIEQSQAPSNKSFINKVIKNQKKQLLKSRSDKAILDPTIFQYLYNSKQIKQLDKSQLEKAPIDQLYDFSTTQELYKKIKIQRAKQRSTHFSNNQDQNNDAHGYKIIKRNSVGTLENIHNYSDDSSLPSITEAQLDQLYTQSIEIQKNFKGKVVKSIESQEIIQKKIRNLQKLTFINDNVKKAVRIKLGLKPKQ